ncbi:MAG TPA: MogA/MoaB family molybdenum cofactor biosynthesis protein [Bellilinea sp.]|nr:MogA/MoaB family molybdenum cofactor biosynthesis protein [Bellilinea sp.]
MLRVGILTVSDRSARGERVDASGPELRTLSQEAGFQVTGYAIAPDELNLISRQLIDWCNSGEIDVIFTTGGTGFSPRDITPEATRAVIEREAPGIAEAIRSASLLITPHGMLSRGIAGTLRHTLIINLPGSPKAAREGFQVVSAVLPHAIELLHSAPDSEAHHKMDARSQE